MPVNEQELVKDLDDPKYLKIVTDTLAAKKIEVLDEKAKTTLLDNFKKDVVEKEIPAHIERVHTQYDADLKTVFGDDYKREANEKTYDALKRVGKAKLDGFATKIADLEAQIKKGDPTGALTKKLQETEDQAKTTIEGLKTKITELEGGAASANKLARFNEVYGTIKAKFQKTLPPMFTQTEKAINSGIIANAVIKDNVLYVGDGSGGIKKDASFKEITVESFLEGEYKDVIDIRKKQGGTGSEGGGKKDPTDNSIDPKTITKDNFEMPGNIKDPEELMTHLMEIGVPRGTKQLTEIWNKYVDPKTNKFR